MRDDVHYSMQWYHVLDLCSISDMYWCAHITVENGITEHFHRSKRLTTVLHSGRCILVHATKKMTPHTWLHLKMFERAQVTEIVSQYSILLNKKPHYVKYICSFLALDMTTCHLNEWVNAINSIKLDNPLEVDDSTEDECFSVWWGLASTRGYPQPASRDQWRV